MQQGCVVNQLISDVVLVFVLILGVQEHRCSSKGAVAFVAFMVRRGFQGASFQVC